MSLESGTPREPSTPSWRKQFPIEAKAEAAESRRQFIGGLAVSGGVIACSQAALQLVPRDRNHQADSETERHEPLVLTKRWQELQTGETLLFHYPHQHSPCLLVKLDDEQFVAFTQKCTHLACPVIPEVDQDVLHCPCHHGAFDLQSGAPLSGPPRTPLRRVLVERAADGQLTAVGLV